MARKPLKPKKLRSQFTKTFSGILGFVFIITAIAALIFSFIAFWDASCAACEDLHCVTSRNGGWELQGRKPMDNSFLWLDAYFIVGVIIGTLLLVFSSSTQTKKSYLKFHPNAVKCTNCKKIGDKRDPACKHCGQKFDFGGDIAPVQEYTSSNPYEEFKLRQRENENKTDEPN